MFVRGCMAMATALLLNACASLPTSVRHTGSVSGRLDNPYAADLAFASSAGNKKRWAKIGADGGFQINGLPSGLYRLKFYDYRCNDSWFGPEVFIAQSPVVISQAIKSEFLCITGG